MESIAGDIGGTKSWLAWVTGTREAGIRVRFEQIYASADFASGEELLRRFVADAQAGTPDCAVLALPGPVHAQRARLTNLDWTLDAAEMQTALGIARVHFMNDFEAAAVGVATLGADELVTLNPTPVEAEGVRAVTGAGTGLGLAFAVPCADGHDRAFASEGGHVDFAPADASQVRLLERLRTRYGHVSWERAVSGSAMRDLHAFCCEEYGAPVPEAPLDGPALSEQAAAGDAVATATLDLFTDLYGAWVGNVALAYRPRGGLYVAGGIAVHLKARLQAPRFMAAATDKGRMRGVVERTPIFLVSSARLGLQGAIAAAGRSFSSRGAEAGADVLRSNGK
ncbi:MAG TPA: glucokinase [Thiobacillaceae bacterium]|nr:glucokinase [Thiobacillaceae bacterium]